VDKKKTGAMDLEGFKKFALSEEANQSMVDPLIFNNIEFREVIHKIRKEQKKKPPTEWVPFLPFDFNSLLNYLSQKTQREKLGHKVETTNYQIEETPIDIKAFIKLFNLKDPQA
jgi:hypothetical protein